MPAIKRVRSVLFFAWLYLEIVDSVANIFAPVLHAMIIFMERLR
jgi:hypothetical protein